MSVRPLALAFALALPALARAAAEEVSYRSGDETVRGFLATPEGHGPFPALVVVHESRGCGSGREAHVPAAAKDADARTDEFLARTLRGKG